MSNGAGGLTTNPETKWLTQQLLYWEVNDCGGRVRGSGPDLLSNIPRAKARERLLRHNCTFGLQYDTNSFQFFYGFFSAISHHNVLNGEESDIV